MSNTLSYKNINPTNIFNENYKTRIRKEKSNQTNKTRKKKPAFTIVV